MVIWLEFRMEKYRDDGHLEDAPHFTENYPKTHSLKKQNLVLEFCVFFPKIWVLTPKIWVFVQNFTLKITLNLPRG